MPRQPTDPNVLTTEQLAARLGMTANTVTRLARAGRLPGLRAGRDWRFYWPAVIEVLGSSNEGTDDQDEDARPD